jgi:hypothetical protein
MKKNLPLLSTMLIKRFEGSCGTFGEWEKKSIVVNDIRSVFMENNNNNKRTTMGWVLT